MACRVLVPHDLADRLPTGWSEWSRLRGEPVARSGTTSTERVSYGSLSLHLKRYLYPFRNAVRGALRNTWVRPSRARREYRMLGVFRSRAGEDTAPVPVAVGERRTLGLLREAFLATLSAPGATPLSAGLPECSATADRLARFLSRVHGAGLIHGSLFARNLLATPAGAFLVVDLDRARAGRGDRPFPVALRARDLAFLDESVEEIGPATRTRTLLRYLGLMDEDSSARDWLGAIDRWRPEARRRLRRRLAPRA